ncbi:hypothetical protein BOW53_09605, partial [Solemya pervernicosa gill symbiont]
RGAAGINGRVKFLLFAWAWMPKTNFRKNSDSPDPTGSLTSHDFRREQKLATLRQLLTQP